MTDYELNNIDPEDIEDLLVKVEKSFNIEFHGNELIGRSTFGELCDYIANKIELEHSDDCTKQQAFYKLRHAITSTLNTDNIKVDTLLEDILPRKNRRSAVRQIENKLGFNLSFLRATLFVSVTLSIVLLASLVGLFINWKFGLSGLLVSIAGFHLANKFGKETDLKTVGELTEKMARENYLKSRRNSTSFNKNEIESILREWFSKDLGLDKAALTRDAKFL